jgi:glycosyltransferase involved in cell wall biosynthesis
LIGKQPLISVIVPAYNAEKYLADAVQSVIDQNHTPMEIIVVDDGSIDETAGVVASFGRKVHYIYQENSGPAIARNTGIGVAKGDILGFIDADDIWADDNITTQLPILLEQPDVDIVLGATQRIRQTTFSKGGEPFENLFDPQIFYSFGASLIRKTVFDKIGMLDPAMKYGEDVDWFLRARDHGISIRYQHEVVLFYRLHDKNMTRQRSMSDYFFMKALKQSIDRRRWLDNTASKKIP